MQETSSWTFSEEYRACSHRTWLAHGLWTHGHHLWRRNCDTFYLLVMLVLYDPISSRERERCNLCSCEVVDGVSPRSLKSWGGASLSAIKTSSQFLFDSAIHVLAFLVASFTEHGALAIFLLHLNLSGDIYIYIYQAFEVSKHFQSPRHAFCQEQASVWLKSIQKVSRGQWDSETQRTKCKNHIQSLQFVCRPWSPRKPTIRQPDLQVSCVRQNHACKIPNYES